MIITLIFAAVVVTAIDATYIIGNGRDAQEGQFPYQARIKVIYPTGGEGMCGGSLIDSKWVLTSAHCVQISSGDRVIGIIVQLGFLNNGPDEPGSLSLFPQLSDIYVHPGAEHPNPINDESHNIALIKLPESVNCSDTIQGITPANPDEYGYLVGADALVSGWGQYLDNQPVLTAYTLQYTNVVIISNRKCRAYYKSINIDVDFSDNIMCAKGTENSGTCDGDSGGPLALNNGYIPEVLIGVVGFGAGKCQSGYPRVFTSVSAHFDWIQDVTGGDFVVPMCL